VLERERASGLSEGERKPKHGARNKRGKGKLEWREREDAKQ
jgi:hypothetical protein